MSVFIGAKPTQAQIDAAESELGKLKKKRDAMAQRFQKSKAKVEECTKVLEAHKELRSDANTARGAVDEATTKLERMKNTRDYFPGLNTRQLALAMSRLEHEMNTTPAMADDKIVDVKKYLWTVLARGLLDSKVEFTSPYEHSTWADRIDRTISSLEEYEYHEGGSDHFGDSMVYFHRVYQLLLDMPQGEGGAGGADAA